MEKYKARPNGVDNKISEKTETEKKQESTEKAVDLAGEMALDYFTGGKGSKIKNSLGNVPIVGSAVNKTWDNAVKKVSGVVSKTPAGNILKAADDSGITDAARSAKDAMNMSSGGKGNVSGKTNKSGVNKTNLTKNNSSFLTNNIMKFGQPPFMTKIYIVGGICFFLLIMMVTIVSGKDSVNLESTNQSSMDSSVSSNININITQGGGTLLTSGESLLSLLGQEKIDAWNNKIEMAVSDKVGTGYGPALAAYNLIQGAYEEGITLPYLWGGGHIGVSKGVNSNWGANIEVAVSGSELQPLGSVHPDGLDCSGFVSWALINGGCSNFNVITSQVFVSLGNATNANNAKVGDIAANSGHVMLVLENTGTTLLVAEAKSSKFGIIFSEYSYDYFNQFTIVDMSNYYAANCNG